MPGAFTPTCSETHLPGYLKSASKFAALGIEKIVVVTTNNRFVKQGLQENRGDMVSMLCDGDGHLVKNMGLADKMGFGVGVRSKRFAMVTENGQVVQLMTEEGRDDCSSTSAANLIALLEPTPEDRKSTGATGVALLALVATQMVDGPTSRHVFW